MEGKKELVLLSVKKRANRESVHIKKRKRRGVV